jgi:hypothetical protein
LRYPFRQAGRSILELRDLAADGSVCADQLAFQAAQADGQCSDLLVQIIMQFTGEVFALFLLGDDQPAASSVGMSISYPACSKTSPTAGICGALARQGVVHLVGAVAWCVGLVLRRSPNSKTSSK